jgi:predicted RNase H-like HicB family nuclease
MKITKEKLKQMIKEAMGLETGETDRTGQPFDPAGIDDSYQVSWDDHLDTMRGLFLQIAMDVIDHYQEKPEEFGILTKEDARKEIIEVLQATVDNFVNDDLPGVMGLGEFLDDEFDRHNEEENP